MKIRKEYKFSSTGPRIWFLSGMIRFWKAIVNVALGLKDAEAMESDKK